MAAQDQAARKEAFVKLQKFVVEQALQLVQYISPAVQSSSPKVMNYQGQPAVGAEADRGLAQGMRRSQRWNGDANGLSHA